MQRNAYHFIKVLLAASQNVNFFIVTALVHSRPSIQVNIKTNIVFYFKGSVLFTLLYLIYLR